MDSRARAGVARHPLFPVLLALAPGLLLQALLVDRHLPLRLAVLAAVCVAVQALIAARRAQARIDLASLVTAAVLALALPPALPLAGVALAGILAIALGRHALGGADGPRFNPAMVAYAALAVFLPTSMYAPVDASSGATLLTQMSNALKAQNTLGEVFAAAQGGPDWTSLVVALAWVVGGAWLMRRGRLFWRIPAGLLLGLGACALLPWLVDADRHASPLTHLLSGSAVFAALFVATDPGSSPRGARAQLLYGAGIGGLLYAIRSWGDYPDGIAFAVLLMNLFAPALDRYDDGLTSRQAAR